MCLRHHRISQQYAHNFEEEGTLWLHVNFIKKQNIKQATGHMTCNNELIELVALKGPEFLISRQEIKREDICWFTRKVDYTTSKSPDL